VRLVVLLALLMSACARAPQGAPKNWKDMSPAEKRQAVQHIADTCKLPRSELTFSDGGEIHFRPNPDASFTSVDCVLQKLKPLNGFAKIGFVGNEAYTNETK